MNYFKCVKLLLLFSLLGTNEGFTTNSKSSHQRTALTSTYTAEIWYPSVAADVFPVHNNCYSNAARELGLFDAVASVVASWILDASNTLSLDQTSLASKAISEDGTTLTTQTQEKLYHLSRDSMREMLLQDVHQRNSLVTADFTRSMYEDTCRFQDGSGLDGAYPMKPWILGCKLLFKGSKSQTTICEESLVVTSDQISFRFESDLEFRGPFSPQVALTGQIMMTRNPLTGLISSYREFWDKDVFEIVKEARLKL